MVLLRDLYPVLRLLWFTETDELGVDIRINALPSCVTKRVMLADISKTFDILGILTLVHDSCKTITLRIMEGRQEMG